MVSDADEHWRLQKAERFLAAAERALEVSDYETAISRGYYAAYHSVLAMLELKTNLNIPRRHATLHNLLASGVDGRLLTDAVRLAFRDLFAAREVADYEDNLAALGDAAVKVDAARRICSAVRTVINRG